MEQNVVQLRVQVIDVQSFTLDLQVPTYLPGRDVTQRIARDAGLDAYWADKHRRLYWLRARGRLVGDDEKLSDMGVIDGELVYLLPQPPPNSGVIERPPEYPETHPYSGAGYLVLISSMVGVLLWALGWGMAVSYDRSLSTVLFPGFALGMLCTTLARHTWGGRGNQARIPATALLIELMLSIVVLVTPVAFQVYTGELKEIDYTALALGSIPGVIAGMLGVMIAWLSWWGAVEPLPPVQIQALSAAQAAPVVVNCGICARSVDMNVQSVCVHGCGQVFHTGCLKAKQALYRGDFKRCAVCDRMVG